MSNIQESRKWNLNTSDIGNNMQQAFDDVDVIDVSMLDNYEEVPAHLHMKGWYAVETDQGIIAYFAEEQEANRYRLDYINRILND